MSRLSMKGNSSHEIVYILVGTREIIHTIFVILRDKMCVGTRMAMCTTRIQII